MPYDLSYYILDMSPSTVPFFLTTIALFLFIALSLRIIRNADPKNLFA